MNTQRAEPILPANGGNLVVHSIFSTIQGEGPFAGTPAIFIRLAGCNIQCPGCDTEYTKTRKILTVSEIITKVNELLSQQKVVVTPASIVNAIQGTGRPLVVITGGEPFRQDFSSLACTLRELGFVVQVESNGLIFRQDFPYHSICLVISPKTPKIDSRLMGYIAALKYVVQVGYVDPIDGLPTRVLGSTKVTPVAKPDLCFKGQIFIQPMDEGATLENQANLKLAVDLCIKYRYRLCIQTHKLCGLD